MMSSSGIFPNFETRIFFHEAEFVYLFLCSVNVNNNINFEEKIGKKVGENIWWAI